MAIQRKPRMGKARSIHITLKGGRKVSSILLVAGLSARTMTDGRWTITVRLDTSSMLSLAYILIQSPQNSFSSSFASSGRQKVSWFIALPKGVQGYTWGADGEEGEKYGRSVKSASTRPHSSSDLRRQAHDQLAGH